MIEKSDAWVKYLFLVPASAVLAAVVVFPIINTIIYSLSKPLSKEFHFSLINYFRISGDRLFWQSFRNTLLYVGASVSAHFFVGLGVALLLNTKIKGRTAFRLVALLPWAIPTVVTAVTWKWIYNPTSGVLNDALFRLHLIQKTLLWLSSKNTAMASIIISNIWRGFPFVMVVLLAGLQLIPEELYESAAIDGANKFQGFLHVTLPGLRRCIMVALALDIVWEFRRFEMVKVLTDGGPGTLTDVLSTTIFKQYFQFFRFEYASALAIVMSLTIFAISIPYVREMMKK